MNTPHSDILVQHIAKVMSQYLEGAITSPEVCLNILVTLANEEQAICDENENVLATFQEIKRRMLSEEIN